MISTLDKPYFQKTNLLIAVLSFILLVVSGCEQNKAPQTKLYRQFVIDRQLEGLDTTLKKNDLSPELIKGKKFRIAVLESGVWSGFPLYLDAVIEALTELGWGNQEVYRSLLPHEKASTLSLIKTLNSKEWSQYIEFDVKSYAQIQLATRGQGAFKLSRENDLDLIIGLGTWAGQDLRRLPKKFNTPCIIMAVSKPIKSGILNNSKDSGRNNFTGRIDLDRFKRQISLFHSIVGFKKLGIVYAGDDSEAALYAGIPDIKAVQSGLRKNGKESFDLIEATDIPASGDLVLISQKYLKSVTDITSQIDAFYLTLQNGVNDNSISRLVDFFIKNKIPTFYMGGAKYVRHVVLFGFTDNYTPIGQFNALKIIKILKGAKPRDLNMIYEANPRIAVNLATAHKIGLDIPADVLKIADEIYNTVE